jgi:hypothetical protein
MQTESSSRAAPAPAGSRWQHYDPCSGLTRASSGCLVSNAEDLRRATAAVAGKRGSGRILPPRSGAPTRWAGGSPGRGENGAIVVVAAARWAVCGRRAVARAARASNATHRVASPAQNPPSTEPPYDEVVPGRRPQPPLYTRPCRGLCLARPLWSDASQTVQMRRSANPSEIIRPTRPRRACQTPAKAHRWSAVMTPRDGGLRADDVAASHRAVDGDGPSIRDARTYAHGTSRGAVAAVSCVWPTIRPILKKLLI